MALGKVMRAGEGCRPGEKLGRAFRPIHIQTQTCPHFHVLYYTSWIDPVNSRLWYYCFPLNCSLRHQMGIQRQTFWATLFPCSWMWLGLLWWLEGGQNGREHIQVLFLSRRCLKSVQKPVNCDTITFVNKNQGRLQKTQMCPKMTWTANVVH